MRPPDPLITIPGFADSPAAKAGSELIAASQRLGSAAAADTLRAWTVAHVFAQRENIFDSGQEPVAPFCEMLRETARLLDQMRMVGMAGLGALAPDIESSPATQDSIEAVTGAHYGNLFKGFSPEAYWDEATALLRTRLERNGIESQRIEGRSVLDAGCGGGRYTGAWRRLGARPALGVDISPINVGDARQRAEVSRVDELRYEEGDVLSLPQTADSMDIVFSNGVLHHTRDWERGIAELLRVLKPGGLGWLYLIENPGGLFWTAIEILRGVLEGVDRERAREALAALNIPGNRIFYMLDHVAVPINIRLTAEQIESALRASGATEIRRLTRGADFDRIERLYQREPYAEVKFGAGEHRYLFSKA